jgi:hypothetical protein
MRPRSVRRREILLRGAACCGLAAALLWIPPAARAQLPGETPGEWPGESEPEWAPAPAQAPEEWPGQSGPEPAEPAPAAPEAPPPRLGEAAENAYHQVLDAARRDSASWARRTQALKQHAIEGVA